MRATFGVPYAPRHKTRRVTVGPVDETTPIEDEHGNRLCLWCGTPVDQTGATRKRDYCRRSCRQRAYEERQHRRRVADALGLNSGAGEGAAE